VGVSVGALGDVGWYTVVQVVPSRVHPPWWPYLLFSFLIAIGAYFLLAGRFGWPVPLDKLERQRLKFAREVKEANARQQAERVAHQAEVAVRKQREAQIWKCGMGLGFVDANDPKNYSVIALNGPVAHQSAQFIGKKATCTVTQSERLYSATVDYIDGNGGFRVRFPEDFSPEPKMVPGGDYFVTWSSEVLGNEFVKGSFSVDGYGHIVKP